MELEVTNTWVNRLIGDTGKPQDQRVTWGGSAGRGGFGAPGVAAPQPLPAGLIRPVRVISEVKVG